MKTVDPRLVLIGIGFYLVAGLFNGLPIVITIILSVIGAFLVYKGFNS